MSSTKALLCPGAAGEGLCVVTVKQSPLLPALCRLISEALPVRFCMQVIQAAYRQSKHTLQDCSQVSGLPFLYQGERKGICNKGMLQRWFSSVLTGGDEKFCPLS